MQSKAATVDAYVASLPADRRAIIAPVLEVIRTHAPRGLEEMMLWGMPVWGIPLSRYPETYNGQPLMLLALASQKNHCALYAPGVMADPANKAAFLGALTAAVKKVDMGGACIRFRSLEALPLPIVADAVKRLTVEGYLAFYEQNRSATAAKKAKPKAAAAKPASKAGAKAAAVRSEARATKAKARSGTIRRAKPSKPRNTAAKKQAAARRRKAR
ncbi:MAG: DUF1801 domain-containing protein [Gemmatimonadetes bacterium]|nr:DUF1801 domain-containing protein [Gemmatimonadota bacterium]